MAAKAVEGRNVKSASPGPAGRTEAADARERAKDFLTTAEVGRLLDATRAGRHGVRNYLLVLMMYRHGLRVSEATALRRDEVDLAASRLWGSLPSATVPTSACPSWPPDQTSPAGIVATNTSYTTPRDAISIFGDGSQSRRASVVRHPPIDAPQVRQRRPNSWLAQPGADRAGALSWPSVVTRSGATPVIAFAELTLAMTAPTVVTCVYRTVSTLSITLTTRIAWARARSAAAWSSLPAPRDRKA